MHKRDSNFGKDYVYFVFTQPYMASYGFSEYSDDVGAVKYRDEKDGIPGRVVSISYRQKANGQPEKYHFSFTSDVRDRAIRVNKNSVDSRGINIVEFLKSHPECKDSPNGKYTEDGKQLDIHFKLRDEEADAVKLLAHQGVRLKAENIAFNLTDEEVFEIAPLFGENSPVPAMAKHTIMDLASNKPLIFLEVYEDGLRKAKSLLKRAVIAKVLTLNGSAVVWNKTTLGLDENEAAAKLASDPTILEALEKAIKRVS